MPVSETVKPSPTPKLEPLADEAMGLVSGGQQFVFRGEGFQRDSWFVNFLTKRLIQDGVKQGLTRPLDAAPQELSVEGRIYRVWQIGGTIYVEEAV